MKSWLSVCPNSAVKSAYFLVKFRRVWCRLCSCVQTWSAAMLQCLCSNSLPPLILHCSRLLPLLQCTAVTSSPLQSESTVPMFPLRKLRRTNISSTCPILIFYIDAIVIRNTKAWFMLIFRNKSNSRPAVPLSIVCIINHHLITIFHDFETVDVDMLAIDNIGKRRDKTRNIDLLRIDSFKIQ